MNPFAALLCLIGLAALASAMPRHHQTVFGIRGTKARLRLLRTGGWLALLLATSTNCAEHGLTLGFVETLAQCSGGGFAITLVLTTIFARRSQPKKNSL